MVRVVKSWMLWLARHVVKMRKKRNADIVFIGKSLKMAIWKIRWITERQTVRTAVWWSSTQDRAFNNVPLWLAIAYTIHSKQLATHLWVVVHALRWPSSVHPLLWFDATLCGNCHTLHWLIVHFLWYDTQLFAATRTQCIHHKENQVAAGNLLNTEWPEVNNMHSFKKMNNPRC